MDINFINYNTNFGISFINNNLRYKIVSIQIIVIFIVVGYTKFPLLVAQVLSGMATLQSTVT
jgi:hypothetical protein